MTALRILALWTAASVPVSIAAGFLLARGEALAPQPVAPAVPAPALQPA